MTYIAYFVLHTCSSSGHSHGKLVGMSLNLNKEKLKTRGELSWSWERSTKRHLTKNYVGTVMIWTKFLSMYAKPEKPVTKLTGRTRPKWKSVVAVMILITMNASLCCQKFQSSPNRTSSQTISRVLNKTRKKYGWKVLILSFRECLTYQISCLKIIETFWNCRTKVEFRKNCDFSITISKLKICTIKWE